jgi:hypothetical protein
VNLHSCPLQMITIMTQIIMGQSVFSYLSQCYPSSQGVSLCQSSPDSSFGFASVLIFRRCFFLRDLQRRSRPPTPTKLEKKTHFVFLVQDLNDTVVHLFIGTGRSYVNLHSCPLQMITIMTQIIMGQSVFSYLSQCYPSSQGVSLCQSSPDSSFGFASVLIFRRCFFLRNLQRRSRPQHRLS